MSSQERRLDDFAVSPFWLAVTVATLGALYEYAQAGLYLIGFLAVIIVMHEGGHFIFAKRAGMKPAEFFWGFGPEIVGVNYNGCRFGFKAVFLGGYVRIHGMTPTSELPEGVAEEGTYRNASHSGRLATILAGPFVNIFFGLLAFGAAALLAGASFGQAFSYAFEILWIVLVLTAEALGAFLGDIWGYSSASVTGAEPPARFTSPISQAELSADAIEGGLSQILMWFGILSAAVGTFNLLPLPPLDGAHAMVAGAEKLAQVIKRDTSVRVDARRLEPLAYLTIGLILVLSMGALLMDLRELGVFDGLAFGAFANTQTVILLWLGALELALLYAYLCARRARTQDRPFSLRPS